MVAPDASCRPLAITFDAVGTLIVPAVPVGKTYAEVGRRHGFELDVGRAGEAFALAYAAASPPTAGVWKGEGGEREWWRALVAEVFRLAGAGRAGRAVELACEEEGFSECFDELYGWYGRAAAWRVIAGVLECLELVGRGRVLGVLSNFDARLNGVLEGLGLAGYFRAVILSGEVGVAKPGAGIFAAAARELGVEAGEILHVGDDPELDGEGARRAGFRSWVIEHGREGRDLAALVAWLGL